MYADDVSTQLNEILKTGGRSALDQVFLANPGLRDQYAINAYSGQVEHKEGLLAPTWTKIALGAVGGLAGGALLAPALFGGGGAAGAGSAAAGAETGASTAVPAIGGAVPGAGAASAGAGASGILGAIGKYGGLASDIGKFATGAAQGSADQRGREANAKVAAETLSRRSAILSALIGGSQDARIQPANPNIAARTPQITGGLRPSAITGNGRGAALQQQLAQPIDIGAGAAENTLGAVGLGASIFGALSPYLRKG